MILFSSRRFSLKLALCAFALAVFSIGLSAQSLRQPALFTLALSLDETISADDQMIPPMILQPFVENCIEHGFRDIDYVGHISIKFHANESQLEAIIEDNGIGLSGDKSKGYPSRATQIIKDRLYLLSKQTGSSGFFEYYPLHEGGMKLRVVFPLLSEHESTTYRR